MDKKETLALIDEFKSGLLSKATGGDLSEPEYKRMRDSLLAIPEISDHIPQLIKSNRSAQDFYRYMQTRSGTYKGRREIIDNEMGELAEFVEFSSEDDVFTGIKQYKRCESLGRGGFGEVFRYHNDCLDMDFAVKIYQPWFMTPEEKKEGEKRFFREAKMLFSLNHPNIVRIYDAGRIDDNPFIRMEYIEGETLQKFHDKNGLFDAKSASKAVIQILSGLQCAHSAGIVHRDLKPSNIMVMPSQGKYICKIIDFGISAFMETEGYTKLTRTGEHIAGGQYIDPALDGKPELRDVRSDIYSTGAILYFLLCGRAPVGSDIKEFLHETNPNVPSELELVIMKCLASELDKRYSSCDELADALKRITAV